MLPESRRRERRMIPVPCTRACTAHPYFADVALWNAAAAARIDDLDYGALDRDAAADEGPTPGIGGRPMDDLGASELERAAKAP
jgi:hypothetical protein